MAEGGKSEGGAVAGEEEPCSEGDARSPQDESCDSTEGEHSVEALHALDVEVSYEARDSIDGAAVVEREEGTCDAGLEEEKQHDDDGDGFLPEYPPTAHAYCPEENGSPHEYKRKAQVEGEVKECLVGGHWVRWAYYGRRGGSQGRASGQRRQRRGGQWRRGRRPS